MANENNNNELVSADDDPTAELEVSSLRDRYVAGDELEVDAKTFDTERNTGADRDLTVLELEYDLRSRIKTIDRLQFDIEQLRAKWLGVESEIKARESQTVQLNADLTEQKVHIDRKEKLLKKRDQKIKSLKFEIRQRDEEHRASLRELEAARPAMPGAVEKPRNAEPTTNDRTESDLRRRLNGADEYADSIRRQLQDKIELSDRFESERDHLAQSLSQAVLENESLSERLQEIEKRSLEMQSTLDTIEQAHQDEIRMLRFELGEAQNTAVESESLNSQLTADLIEVRSRNDDAERSLCDAEEKANTHVKQLQKEVKTLSRAADKYEQKLTTKSEAISVLLSELAKKSSQLDSIEKIEDVIHDIDDRMSERFIRNSNEDRNISSGREDRPSHGNAERISRVLVGTIDNQVLRFPLFKNRLTIGRTEESDIQLKAIYISRRHAVIQTDGDATRIIDWGSKNGIFVNSERVNEHFLCHGDIVTIGQARFRYEERKKREL